MRICAYSSVVVIGKIGRFLAALSRLIHLNQPLPETDKQAILLGVKDTIHDLEEALHTLAVELNEELKG